MNTQPIHQKTLGAVVEPGDEKNISHLTIDLNRLLYDYGVLIVKDKDYNEQQQLQLLENFGRVETRNNKPYCMRVTNQGAKLGTASSAPAGTLPFHYDYAYDPQAVSVISLYGENVDPGGTPTLFANSRCVEQLPDAVYNAIVDRQIVHCCFPEQYDYDFLQGTSRAAIARGEPGWGPEHFWLRQPILRPDNRGEVSLYVCQLYAHSIIGLPEDESNALLQELYQTLYSEHNVYQHNWQTGDLLIWDNRVIQHARPSPEPKPEEKTRTLRRFSVGEVDITADYLKLAYSRELM